MKRLRILTWHVHGSYLYYLGFTGHDIYVPVRDGRPAGWSGLPAGPFPWQANLHEIPADELRGHPFDCVLYQSRAEWDERERLLSAEQLARPAVYLEHDPPREHPTDTTHAMTDPGVLLVHVTPFNALMWESGDVPTRVIVHGVVIPDGVRASGATPRAIAVVNNITSRGRRLGADVYQAARRAAPVDLVGMNAEAAGGIGEVPHDRLPAFLAPYRVFFNPIRYTSLGLALCEAMMIGLPVVGLATTQVAAEIENGVTGYVDTALGRVIDRLRALIADPAEARALGENARRYARDRFGIDRFVRDWNDAFGLVTGERMARWRAEKGRMGAPRPASPAGSTP